MAKGLGGSVRFWCGLVAVCLSVSSIGVSQAMTQEESALDRAERLANEGEIREARQALASWESEHGELAPLNERVRAWYISARLTEDASEAELLYLRVIIEGSSTRYADDALLRLGQYMYTTQAHDRAIDYMVRLRRDYPTSEHAPEALLWIARSARALGDNERSCAAAEQGLSELAPAANPDLEIALLEQSRGCRDTEGSYTVQIAAFRDEVAAQNLARELLSMGFDAWVLGATSEDPVHRVRVGRRLIRGEAEALHERLTRMGYSPFIVQQQQPPGGS